MSSDLEKIIETLEAQNEALRNFVLCHIMGVGMVLPDLIRDTNMYAESQEASMLAGPRPLSALYLRDLMNAVQDVLDVKA